MDFSRTRKLAVVSAAISAILGALPAAAAYKIGGGDVLTFSVAGLPELTAKVPVDIDGQANLPIVGAVSVAGLSVPEVLAKVQAVLPGKEYRRRTEDGREFPVIISPGEINLSVAEYRPVYLNGDIAKPGAERFTPGLTVRNAVALAGGFDILRFKMDNPFLQLSDLTGQYNALWVEYAKQQAELARLEAELDGKPQLETKALIGTPLAPSLAQDILSNEDKQLKVRDADFEKEEVYLKAAALKETDRAQILSEQQAKEQDGVKADQADLQRYTELFAKGAVALPGLSDARRTVLLSSTRALQTTALLDSVEREQQDLTRKLDRIGDTRRMELLKEAQDATVALADTRAKLQAVSEKLRYTGMVKSQLVRGVDSQPRVTIIRQTDERPSQIEAGLDTQLEPGDAVEIALQAQTLVASGDR